MSGAYAGDRTTGFASPASDSTEGPIDLSAALDLQRPNRYPVRVVGDALAARGILHGDILIVDTAARPQSGCVVVARWQDQTIVCEITRQGGGWWLRSGKGQDAQMHRLDPAHDSEVWAVVAALVRTQV
ncbi:error-prone repair protein UmuD [Komagataeibacter nataicola]|uniref:Error-prone repair protein UmuD n=1 Tax=Komagataeibacter nataicola TaxID=265960 RepID=A0A9N7H393_9PROT|nr:S24 family peptidase [Komagataeibacter nataicola]AQU87948.1 error-prone repair protein UmuD [Komagataeibacter nataicola]PYD66477.1 error-prone repair protein UmuD [Komagataeibacter nataicola]WNM09463.1 S24 family peptidase [Komagataeibacter nataicola]GBR26649.1 SOS mutagenesis protein UmuD [Komagataeibacter nataicola NRIC 0616]